MAQTKIYHTNIIIGQIYYYISVIHTFPIGIHTLYFLSSPCKTARIALMIADGSYGKCSCQGSDHFHSTKITPLISFTVYRHEYFTGQAYKCMAAILFFSHIDKALFFFSFPHGASWCSWWESSAKPQSLHYYSQRSGRDYPSWGKDTVVFAEFFAASTHLTLQ